MGVAVAFLVPAALSEGEGGGKRALLTSCTVAFASGGSDIGGTEGCRRRGGSLVRGVTLGAGEGGGRRALLTSCTVAIAPSGGVCGATEGCRGRGMSVLGIAGGGNGDDGVSLTVISSR